MRNFRGLTLSRNAASHGIAAWRTGGTRVLRTELAEPDGLLGPHLGRSNIFCEMIAKGGKRSSRPAAIGVTELRNHCFIGRMGCFGG